MQLLAAMQLLGPGRSRTHATVSRFRFANIELPIGFRPSGFPGRAGLGGQGSWAGPAWFWLGGEPGWWGAGGKGVISRTSNITFHWILEKNVKAIRSYQFFDTRLLAAMK